MIRRLLLRTFFLASLGISFALHVHAIREDVALTEAFDMLKTTAQVLNAHHITVLHSDLPMDKAHRKTVRFQRPDCAGPSIAMPFTISTQAIAQIPKRSPANHTQTVKYLRESWDSQHSFELIRQWASNALLVATGHSDFVPVRSALLLIEPAGCRKNDPVDWSQVWLTQSKTSGSAT